MSEWLLILMDSTLRHNSGYTPEQGDAGILELEQRCPQVDFILF